MKAKTSFTWNENNCQSWKEFPLKWQSKFIPSWELLFSSTWLNDPVEALLLQNFKISKIY